MPDQTNGAEDLPLLSEPRDGTPELIDTHQALQAALSALSESSEPVAIDTERAQGRRYGANAYLVQLRKEDVGTFLIDSHELSDLSLLQPALQTEWIFHAPDQDLRCLIDLGLQPTSLFDTEIAARLLGDERFSLGAVTEHYLGMRLQKNHQNEDWSVRPLPKDWLTYAALDVEVLPALRSVLAEGLSRLGRTEWAAQEFDFQLSHPVTPKAATWRNLKGIGRLRRPTELAIARELWTAREEIGRVNDIAPGRILASGAILEAASKSPAAQSDMLGIEGFRRPLARKRSAQWWAAIERARALSPQEQPRRQNAEPGAIPAAGAWKRIDPEAAKRLGEVRELVAQVGEDLQLSPDVVLSPRAQRTLAWRPLGSEQDPPSGSFLDLVETRLQQGEARSWQRDLVLKKLETSRESVPSLRGS